ncbi:hypothetical protein BIW11_10456 [Tropilaelaps mercedesae]|uniref:Uncharacterized protein n=1 Tax=Tropilaelaps mercedesae TaxID=418985 RepID=A0A1V9XFJ9_9ACAR|nr:hypothetical protein BIW11_10456 [Tropilaelaps mercedesae]
MPSREASATSCGSSKSRRVAVAIWQIRRKFLSSYLTSSDLGQPRSSPRVWVSEGDGAVQKKRWRGGSFPSVVAPQSNPALENTM